MITLFAINTILLFSLFVIWSKKNWINLFIKLALGALCVANALQLFLLSGYLIAP